MKKFLFLILTVIPIYLTAQSNINRIGPFVIGQTKVEIIDSLSKKFGIFKKIDNYSDSFSLDNYESCYNIDNPYRSPQGSSPCNECRIFFLKKIEISGVRIDNVYLKFYNNVLVEFKSSYGKDIEEALTIKYGPPKSETKEEKTTCINKLTGNKYSLDGYSIYHTWGDENIQANGGYSLYYNDKCKEQFITWFSLESKSINKKIENCEKIYEEKNKVSTMEKKAQTLTDF